MFCISVKAYIKVKLYKVDIWNDENAYFEHFEFDINNVFLKKDKNTTVFKSFIFKSKMFLIPTWYGSSASQ